MKFTIFGLTLSSSWGNGHATPYRSLIRALHAQGHQVTFFERDNIYYARHRDFTECDYCELVIYPDWDAARETALRAAAESDVVITASYLSEGARITDEVLALARWTAPLLLRSGHALSRWTICEKLMWNICAPTRSPNLIFISHSPAAASCESWSGLGARGKQRRSTGGRSRCAQAHRYT